MGPLNNEGVAVKMDEHVADALERGASVVTRRRARERRSQPTCTGSRRFSPACRRTPWSPPTRRSARSRPSSSIDSLEQAIELDKRLALRPAGGDLHRRPAGPDCEFADRVRTGWVNVNESSNYWESHLPFGGRAGTDSGIGRVGGTHVMQSFTELQTVVLG